MKQHVMKQIENVKSNRLLKMQNLKMKSLTKHLLDSLMMLMLVKSQMTSTLKMTSKTHSKKTSVTA
jgi:hypothetical protein